MLKFRNNCTNDKFLLCFFLAERGDGIRVEFTNACEDDWTEFTFESTGKIKHKKTGKCLAQRDVEGRVKKMVLELTNDCINNSHTSWQIKEYSLNKGKLKILSRFQLIH